LRSALHMKKQILYCKHWVSSAQQKSCCHSIEWQRISTEDTTSPATRGYNMTKMRERLCIDNEGFQAHSGQKS